MSDNELDCCQAVDRVYLAYFGFSFFDDFGLNNRIKLTRMMVKLGGLEKAMEHVLDTLHFQECEPEAGSIAFDGEACVICLGNNTYAQKSSDGVLLTRHKKKLRNWKCPK